MKCAYNDGLRVDYTGSLHISKGSDVDLVIKAEEIPERYKEELVGATRHYSCSELRGAALEVVDAVDSYIP
jgi:hypothetical protein